MVVEMKEIKVMTNREKTIITELVIIFFIDTHLIRIPGNR